MSLKDQMRSDMGAVFLNQDEFAITGSYTPQGGTASFVWTCVPGDVAPAVQQGHGGTWQDGQNEATGSFEAFLAGMATIGRTGQRPVRGDSFVVAAGSELAGIWKVESFSGDVGGGLKLTLVTSDWFTVGAQGVRNV